MIILLDLDGVCVDFISGVSELLGRDIDHNNWPIKGEFALEKIYDAPINMIWKIIDNEGPEFWARLTPYIDFFPMYNLLCKYGKVYFCTSPSISSDCVKGKLMWLQDKFGMGFRNYIFTCKKHLLAGPDRVLIDDSDMHCEKFAEAGGRSILYPRLWNKNYDIEDSDAFLFKRMERICGLLRQ